MLPLCLAKDSELPALAADKPASAQMNLLSNHLKFEAPPAVRFPEELQPGTVLVKNILIY
ncbi:hypothetical protein D9M70_556400 [compost metagenome]